MSDTEMPGGSGEPSRHPNMSSPDPSPGGDVVGRDVLVARCSVLETSVRNSGVATPAQLDAARPGGAENPDRSALGWLYFFGALSRWHAQGPQQPVRSSMRWDPAAHEELRRALHAEPIELTLECGERVTCYPKGELAIKEVMFNQLALQWVTALRITLEGMTPSAEHLTVLAHALDAEQQLMGEFVAIVLHPGAGIPWAQRSRWDRALPEVTTRIGPADLFAIRRAYWELNLLRVNVIADRTREFVKGSEAMPIEAFIGTLAGEMQIQPEVLVREWSRGETFAMSLTRFEATERAKQRAEADRPDRTSGAGRG